MLANAVLQTRIFPLDKSRATQLDLAEVKKHDYGKLTLIDIEVFYSSAKSCNYDYRY